MVDRTPELRAARARGPVVVGLLVAAVLAIVLVAALPRTAPAAATWEIQRAPTRLTLRDVDFVDERHGWIVGGQGEHDEKCVILRTADGGASWQNVACPLPSRLHSVSFVSARTGWAVGMLPGLILRTDDGGDSWTRQDPGTTAQLSSVLFLDAQVGWISVAEADYLLKTTDGGLTWQRSMLPEREDISVVAFVDPAHGWALGGDGVLLATDDAGGAWRYVDFGSDSHLDGISFPDLDHGWLTGWEIRATGDGGRTWRGLGEPENTLLDVIFFDARHGCAVGDKGLIQCTWDAGETWVQQAKDVSELSYLAIGDAGPRWLWAVGVEGLIVRGHDPDAVVLPTGSPTAVPTATPRPTPTPTATPRPTPTPTGPWVRLGDAGRSLLVGPGSRARFDVAWGNMPATLEIAGEISGPATFEDGTQVLSATVTRSSGSGTYPVGIAARADAVRGERFSVQVTVAGNPAGRTGTIAWQCWLPWGGG